MGLSWVQLEQGMGDSEMLPGLLRELHTLKGEAGLMGFARIASIVHALEELLRPQTQGASADSATGDLLLRGLDLISAAIEKLSDVEALEADSILTDLRVRGVQRRSSASPIAPVPQRPARERSVAVHAIDTIRVTSAKLERLRDLIGELMLTQSRMELSASEFRQAKETAQEYRHELASKNAPAERLFAMLLNAISGIEARLRDDSYRISDLVAELNDATRALRMVPIRTLFEQYPVAVRELARKLGREARLELVGDELEVDRSVLERLTDPLLHLLQNAVDHGVESAEERRRAGKSAEGRITVCATLVGHTLDIAVADDGAGIDVAAVRARAVELGILDAGKSQALSDEQILRTLFYARMSMRHEVTQISGRGVGLDVVQTCVEGLGGRVTVQSKLGSGTTFTLSVPVSLAMTSILLFTVGASRYAIPASTIVTLIDGSSQPHEDSITGPAIRYAGGLVPLVQLDELLGETVTGSSVATTDRSAVQRLIIVNTNGGLLAIAGTSRHLERAVVLKSMGKFFARNRLVNAAVPLEDGTLVFVLSVNELLGGVRGVRAATTTIKHKQHDRKSVLVVDDSPLVRDLLAEALRAHGLRVREASDGEDALTKLDEDPRIDLVVTDVDMPKLDGIGLLSRLRQRSGPRLPVVIVSMRGSDEDQRRALDAGADAYLVKTDLSHAGLWTMLSRFLE